MSDATQGPGWWMASDGRWYPPELRPAATLPPPPPGGPPAAAPPRGAPPSAVPWAALPWQSGGPWRALGSRATPPWRVSPEPGLFGRGLRLATAGFALARDEPGLLALAAAGFAVELLVLALGALAVAAGFAAVVGGPPGSFAALGVQVLVVVATAVVALFVSAVVHAAIVWRVSARFRGEALSNGDALAAVLAVAPRLLVWSLVHGVVRMFARNVRSRGVAGALASSAAGVAWSLVSVFVVPVMLFERLGPLAAIRRSSALCRERWGEDLAGRSVLAAGGLVAVLAVLGVSAVVATFSMTSGVAVGVAGLAAVVVSLTVASASFGAALYRFAVTGQVPEGYRAGDLAQDAGRARAPGNPPG